MAACRRWVTKWEKSSEDCPAIDTKELKKFNATRKLRQAGQGIVKKKLAVLKAMKTSKVAPAPPEPGVAEPKVATVAAATAPAAAPAAAAAAADGSAAAADASAAAAAAT